MNQRSLRLILAVVAGVLIGVILEVIVEYAVDGDAGRALAYGALTAAAFVAVRRNAERLRL